MLIAKEEFAVFMECGIAAAIFYAENTEAAKSYTEKIWKRLLRL